jgi:hypothetical protein
MQRASRAIHRRIVAADGIGAVCGRQSIPQVAKGVSTGSDAVTRLLDQQASDISIRHASRRQLSWPMATPNDEKC